MSEKTLLHAAKNYLIERATFYYLDRRGDLDMKDATDYKDHFRQLAILLYKIDIATKISDYIILIENDELSSVGIFPDEVEDFLEDIMIEFNKK